MARFKLGGTATNSKRRVAKFGASRDARGLWHLRRLPVVLLIVCVALFAAAYAGWRQVWPLLHARPEYQISLSNVWVTAPPPWVQRNLLDDLRAWGDLPETMSLLDQNLVGRLAEVFARHPWVAEVEQVRIVRPRRIEIRLRYRRPVAVVETLRGLLPVDSAGTLLPTEDFAASEAAALPVIRGVQSSPLGPAGHPWKDPLVQGGAKIAETLAPHWKELGLNALEGALWQPGPAPTQEVAHASELLGETIEEENSSKSEATLHEEGTYYLLSRGGTRVVWGRPPNSNHPGEIPASEKIARLKDYVQQYGSLEQPDGPYELDIRHWKDLSRRPRAAASAELR